MYEFKKIVRGPKYSPSVVNYVPMVGPALATNLLSAFDDDLPEEDQKEAFEYIDKKKTGTLDKTGSGRPAPGAWQVGARDPENARLLGRR